MAAHSDKLTIAGKQHKLTVTGKQYQVKAKLSDRYNLSNPI